MNAGQAKHFPQIKNTDSFIYIHTKGWNIELPSEVKQKMLSSRKQKLVKPVNDTFLRCESLLRTTARREKS